MIVSEERAAWLAGLKVGDVVIAHGAHSPPSARRLVFTDHTRIFYGDADAPDWVWKHTGYALLDTSSQRWIEPA